MTTLLLVAYVAGMAAISSAVHRRNKDFAAFVVASRNLSVVVASLSLIATKIGAAILFGTVASASVYGVFAGAFPLSAAVGFIILGLTIASSYNKTGIYTVPEFIERNYGRAASLLSALMLVTYLIIVLSIQFTAGSAILTSFSGLPLDVCLVLFALTTAGFVIVGGMWGIVYVDIFQLGWIYVGFAILSVSTIVGSGGLGFLLSDNLQSVGGAKPIAGETILGWFVASVSNALVSQGFVQRMSAARNPASAGKAAVLAGIVMIPLAFFVTIIGMGSKYMNPNVSGQDALIYQANLLPPPMASFLLMAIFAVVTSSVENILHSVSIITQRDILQKIRPQEYNELKVVRIVIAATAAVGILVAHSVKQDIVATWVFAAGISSVGIVIPVLFACFGKRNSLAALVSLIAPVAVAVTNFFAPIAVRMDPTTLGLLVAGSMYFFISYIIMNKHETRVEGPA